MNKTISVFLVAALAAIGQTATYTVEALPESKQARVTVLITKGESSKEFRMPAWAPGDYEIFDYGKKIESVKFFKDGQEVAGVQGDDPNLWTVEGGATKAVYTVNESRGNFSPNLRVTEDEMFVSGPGVLGWFSGHAKEEHSLYIRHLGEGSKAACALDPLEASQGYTGYHAVDYDELIDSPFVVGKNVRVHSFMVEGKPHAIVGYNKSENVDLKQYEQNATKLAIEAKKLFGELPYDRYYFLFDFGGPGGGLEHLDSTKIGLSPRSTARQALSIMSHEYFHTFNVKRIRSQPLGPFDYTKPAVTGALWWLEGVTDYYADVLAYRGGLIDRAQFLKEMTGAISGLSRNNARLAVSADESSRRVWETRWSNGFGGLSYYTKGKNVGIALDLAIRAYSGNENSLDDVMRQLYAECMKGPGFSETRIREICIEYGGQNLGPIYDQCVYQAVEMPFNTIFQISGLAMTPQGISENTNVPAGTQLIGKVWPNALAP